MHTPGNLEEETYFVNATGMVRSVSLQETVLVSGKVIF
jgi:hypothetical protein